MSDTADEGNPPVQSFRGVEWARGGPMVLLSGKDGTSPAILLSVHAEPESLAEEVASQLEALLNGHQTRQDEKGSSCTPPGDVIEILNHELVVRLVLQAVSPDPRPDRWALAHDIVTALERWSSIPPEEIDERLAFLQVLGGGRWLPYGGTLPDRKVP